MGILCQDMVLIWLGFVHDTPLQNHQFAAGLLVVLLVLSGGMWKVGVAKEWEARCWMYASEMILLLLLQRVWSEPTSSVVDMVLTTSGLPSVVQTLNRTRISLTDVMKTRDHILFLCVSWCLRTCVFLVNWEQTKYFTWIAVSFQLFITLSEAYCCFVTQWALESETDCLALLSSAYDALFVLDADGKIIESNARFDGIFGHSMLHENLFKWVASGHSSLTAFVQASSTKKTIRSLTLTYEHMNRTLIKVRDSDEFEFDSELRTAYHDGDWHWVGFRLCGEKMKPIKENVDTPETHIGNELVATLKRNPRNRFEPFQAFTMHS